MTLKEQLRKRLHITQDGVEDVHDSLEHVTEVVEAIILDSIVKSCHAVCQATLGENLACIEITEKYAKEFYDIIFKEGTDES